MASTRAAVDREAQRRAEYQTTAAYQNAPHSNFNTAPPQVLVTTAPAATAPAAAAPAAGGEAVIRKDGKPVVGITYPADWKQITDERYVSAVSADGQAYSMIAALPDAADQQAGIAKVKQGLEQYLQDIKYDDQKETKRGALVVTGTGKAKKSGVDVVFAAGVFDTGAGKLAGAAFVVDARIEDYYKENSPPDLARRSSRSPPPAWEAFRREEVGSAEAAAGCRSGRGAHGPTVLFISAQT